MNNNETKEFRPAYYAIIPASVRYAQNLSSSTKLLYGEITALCNERGYCWATNDYFANLYGVKKATISEWVSQLVTEGLLAREIIYKEDSKEIAKRVLRLTESLPLSDKNRIPPMEKSDDPIPKKPKDNNTMNSIFITEVINREYPNNLDLIPLVIDWIEYKKSEKKQSYKTEKSLKTFINRLIKLSDGNFEKAKDLIETSIANNWSGLFASTSKNYSNQPKSERRNSDGFKSGSQLYRGL